MEKINCVLLIDDDPTTNYINESLLHDLNISKETIVFTNATEALAFLERDCEGRCPELILLDIKMPVIDGFEFLEEFEKLMFKNKENVKVVMLSSSLIPKEVEISRNLGATDYLQKPLTTGKLGRLMHSYFN